MVFTTRFTEQSKLAVFNSRILMPMLPVGLLETVEHPLISGACRLWEISHGLK